MKSLAEQYRPRRWADLVGQPKVVRQVDTLRKRGLDGKPLTAYVTLVKESGNSMRRALQRIESGAMMT